MSQTTLETSYDGSRALVIGINTYQKASPLQYAVNDATEIAKLLSDKRGFPKENVHILIDQEASRSRILERFLSFASVASSNDRLIVYFAGHGHTLKSRKGDVGYLVPWDGDPTDLASLIRWDELTRNADLIAAKHILFIMDACYGGLAVTRALKPGSMRFLKDMLLRRALQVVAAGKADEVVADLGGPLPSHSVFTGHLLQALEGKAADSEGILTANGVMAYVYQMVGRDSQSEQTPHYGYLDGDGDLVFAPRSEEMDFDEKRDDDILVPVPAVNMHHGGEEIMTKVDLAKEYLSDVRHKIQLYDLVSEEVRRVISLTGEDAFDSHDSWSDTEFTDRLNKYEDITSDICRIEVLISHWSELGNGGITTLTLKRLCDRFGVGSGLNGWLALRWYPALLLMYCAGIAAIAAEKYHTLRDIFHSEISSGSISSRHAKTTMVLAVREGISDADDLFKLLPGHERQYTARSEYLFKTLQPVFDDLLFLGHDYEAHFDTFEVMYALEHAEQFERLHHRFWAPAGRFGWKHQRGADSSPFHRIVADADQQGASWAPIQAGLFGGSSERFKETADGYQRSLSQLGWL